MTQQGVSPGSSPGPLRRMAPVAGLFFLAPLVGEFLLGNLPISMILALPFFAMLYGTGALLIREVARRTGRGWPSIALLAAAYALIEEGPVDQLLWNPSYAGHDYLHGDSYVPALGMSVELTQTILALHTIWSICVPIAIVEALVPARRTTPWLGRVGLGVIAVMYVLGAGLVFWGNYADERFMASPAQLIGAGVAVAGLVVLAFRVPRRPRPAAERPSPSPWVVGVVALTLTSLYWGPGVLVTAGWYEWAGVAVWFLVAVTGVPLVLRWSRRRGWDDRHRFALAAGAMLTYVWTAFPVRPEADGVSPATDLAGNAVFGGAAVLLLVLAGRSVCAIPAKSGLPVAAR
jgi:preprotein translocase subunit Sec61beta